MSCYIITEAVCSEIVSVLLVSVLLFVGSRLLCQILGNVMGGAELHQLIVWFCVAG